MFKYGKIFLLIAFAGLIQSCTTTKLYDGPALSEAESAIFYTNGSIAGPFINWVVDGKKTLQGSLTSPKAVFLTPGKHEIEVNVFIDSSMMRIVRFANGEEPARGFYFLRTYRFKVDLLPGYSYQVEHPRFSLAGQKFMLCMYGEKHDAPGSKVGWGHETRDMSENAERIDCVSPAMIQTSDLGRIENPEKFPDYLLFPRPLSPNR